MMVAMKGDMYEVRENYCLMGYPDLSEDDNEIEIPGHLPILLVNPGPRYWKCLAGGRVYYIPHVWLKKYCRPVY